MSGSRNSKDKSTAFYQPVSQNFDPETDSEVEDVELNDEKAPLKKTADSSAIIPLEILDSRHQAARNNPFDPSYDSEAEETNYRSQLLDYLYIFSEKELEELEEQYGMDRYSMDSLIKAKKWIYRLFLGENTFSIGTDILYTPFQIITGSDGVQSVAHLINKDYSVSNTVGLLLSMPGALVDLAFNMSAVSPTKEAIKSTLSYLTRESYREQAQEFLENAREKPGQATFTVVKWGFNKSVLYTHNLIGATANILAFYEPIPFSLPGVGDVTIPALLPLLPVGAQIGIAAGLGYGGNRYYSLFSNPDYYQNLDEFWIQGIKDLWNNNPDGSPWIIGELYRGQIATPLQIAIQGLISTVAIRAYPNFYYIAEETFGKLLGLNPSTTAALSIATAVIVAWHTLCARYPKTYNRYMADHIKIEALLKKKYEETVEATINSAVEAQIDSLNLALSPIEINKRKQELKTQLMKDFVKTNKKLLEAQIKEAEGSRYAFKKDSALGPQLTYRALVGLYLGYNSIAPLLRSSVVDEPISMTLLSMLLGSGLLANALYQAEKNRITDHLIRQKLDPEMKVEQAAVQGSGLSNRVADTITIGSNVSRALSVLGSAKRVFGNDNAAATSATAIIAVENMINSILFSMNKIRSTVSGWSCFARKNNEAARVSNVRGTIFDRGPVNAPRLPLDEDLELQANNQRASGWRSYLPGNRG